MGLAILVIGTTTLVIYFGMEYYINKKIEGVEYDPETDNLQVYLDKETMNNEEMKRFTLFQAREDFFFAQKLKTFSNYFLVSSISILATLMVCVMLELV